MERVRHECEENCNKLTIYYTGDNWAMRSGKFAWWLTFCPFCGLKLELPDMKIEVGRRSLEAWRALLFRTHRILGQLDNRDLIMARGGVSSVLGYIEDLLDD